MRRFVPIVRLLLSASVLVLLIAPLTQATDRHDHFTPHDAELNLCALAMVATAGYWTARRVAEGRQVRKQCFHALAAAPTCGIALTTAIGLDADASPPGPSASLLRI